QQTLRATFNTAIQTITRYGRATILRYRPRQIDCIAVSRRDQQRRLRTRVRRRIICCVQTLAAGQSNDSRFVCAVVVEAIDLAVAVAIDSANTFGSHTAVSKRCEHAALFVDSDIVEVEEIASA